MKDIIKKLFKNIFFDTFLYAIMILILYFILDKCGYVFLNSFKYFNIILISIGIVIGAMKLVNETDKSDTKKAIVYSIIIAVDLLIVFLIISAYAFFHNQEEIVYKDDKKMVKETHSFLLSNWIKYYDYENIFVRKKKARICEEHDDYIGDWIYTIYYDDNENVIKTESKYDTDNNINNEIDNKEKLPALNNFDIYNTENKEQLFDNSNNNDIEVLYEKEFDSNTIIRIVVKGYILAQRSIIGIQKSYDGGETWVEQLQTEDKFIQIHNGAKFIFFDENIGFINDFGLAGTSGDNRQLLVTTNGGESFEEISVKPNELKEKIYIEDVPYLDNNVLKVKAYVLENSNKKYIELYSKDKGLTWKKL